MIGSHALHRTIRIGELLVVGALLVGCLQPRTLTTEAGIEAQRSARSSGGAAARGVNQVRLGHGLDVDGKVPPGFAAKSFVEGDPIQLSMGLEDASSTTAVHVAVHDLATDRTVWSQEKDAGSGEPYLSFDLGRSLARGEYRADVIIADAVVSRLDFEVYGRKN